MALPMRSMVLLTARRALRSEDIRSTVAPATMPMQRPLTNAAIFIIHPLLFIVWGQFARKNGEKHGTLLAKTDAKWYNNLIEKFEEKGERYVH